MRTSGWLCCGAGIFIPKGRGSGSRKPVKNNSFSRFTQLTILRLLTTEKIMGKDARTMSEAWSLWDRVWADTRVAFLPEPDDLEREFRSRSRLSTHSPKMWADAYLLAFTSVAGLKFVTFDRAVKSRRADVLVL